MRNSPRPPKTTWIGFGFVTGILGLAVCISLYQSSRLPPPLPVLGDIADFTLTNQDNKIFTRADLTNHVWVADIIFTRCAGPCPRMTAQMKSVQDSLPGESNARLVTLTTDADYDSPAVMKKYGERFGANFDRWNFLTGTKEDVALLAANSLKLSAKPVAPGDQQNPADLFIHTTMFVVVDKHARMRAVFETGGEDVDWSTGVRPKLMATLRRLEREP